MERLAVIPDLTFPRLSFGTTQVPLDLRHHLYKGLSEVNVEVARDAIIRRQGGKADLKRLPLILAIHGAIQTRITLGSPIDTVRNLCRSLRYFFAWCDNNERSATTETIVEDFLLWAEYLLSRTKANPTRTHGKTTSFPVARKSRGSERLDVIKAQTACDFAAFVSRVLAEALGMTRPLIRYTRLPEAARKERKPYSNSDKVSFDSASQFGSTLLNICDELTLEKTLGPLPVTIRLRDGQELSEWCKMQPPEKLKSLNGLRPVAEKNIVLRNRKAWEEDRTVRTRHPVVNLRIECEMLIFLSQTGMNLAQANMLGREKFSYRTQGDDVIVTTSYKGRRGGIVKFKVFREYRPLFKRYLAWIEHFVPAKSDDRLFPFYYPSAIPAPDRAPNLSSTRIKMSQLGIEFIGPKKLRNLRVNWIRTYTGSDLIAAESAQHTLGTLRNIYAKPNHAIAAQEIAKYHRSNHASREAPAPGKCINKSNTPTAIAGMPSGVAPPDCVSPSGCFFCVYHRDISSQDYMWSLASYRRLKILEVATLRPSQANTSQSAAEIVVERATMKLDAIAASSAIRKLWVDEALNRLREGNYHPYWAASITMLEI